MQHTALLGLASFILLFTGVLSAAEFRADERAVVASDEVIDDDLYIFGDEVSIDGEVQGDVVVFGRVIHVNGSVQGDLIAAGQAIVIRGNVGDDVRIAGQVIKIDEGGAVADHVIAAGFSLEVVAGSSIEGDLVYGGYQGFLGGNIGGRVEGAKADPTEGRSAASFRGVSTEPALDSLQASSGASRSVRAFVGASHHRTPASFPDDFSRRRRTLHARVTAFRHADAVLLSSLIPPTAHPLTALRSRPRA